MIVDPPGPGRPGGDQGRPRPFFVDPPTPAPGVGGPPGDPARPVFVDPPAPGREPGPVPPDSVYERTMDVGRLFRPPPAADTPPVGSRTRLPALAVAGLALAAVVVVAALLLLLGVI